MWVTNVSSSLNLLITNSMPLLLSTTKVSMVISLSSSIIFSDNCTLILIFFKYSALRMANYLCFDFYKWVLLNYDIIISNISPYLFVIIFIMGYLFCAYQCIILELAILTETERIRGIINRVKSRIWHL